MNRTSIPTHRIAVATAILAGVLLFTGCESVSSLGRGVREKLGARDESRKRVFAADRRVTYEAARVALADIGFRFVRGGAAQGELEGMSGLTASSNSFQQTRQVSLMARFTTVEGGTEVTVSLKEIIEDDAAKGADRATESPLRDTPLYEVFLRQVEQALSKGQTP